MASSQNRLRKSQSLRQRITPTYTHHQIFNDFPTQLHKIRCTPTFTSNAFDCEGYNTITTHSRVKQEERPIHSGSITYRNVSKQRKNIEVFSYRGTSQQDNQKQTDRKEQILHSINDYGVKTSRMRKIVEQMSNPIFGLTYFWQPQLNQKQVVNYHHQNQTVEQAEDKIKKQKYKQNQNEKQVVNEIKSKEKTKENSPLKQKEPKLQAKKKIKVDNQQNRQNNYKKSNLNTLFKTTTKKQPLLVNKK